MPSFNLDIYGLRSALEDALDSLEDIEQALEEEKQKLAITESDLDMVIEILDEKIRELFDTGAQRQRRLILEELAKRLDGMGS